MVSEKVRAEKDTPKTGYHLIAYRYDYSGFDEAVEFYDDSQIEELEARIKELLSREYEAYKEEDIYVIRGTRIPFMVDRDVVREVKVNK